MPRSEVPAIRADRRRRGPAPPAPAPTRRRRGASRVRRGQASDADLLAHLPGRDQSSSGCARARHAQPHRPALPHRLRGDQLPGGVGPVRPALQDAARAAGFYHGVPFLMFIFLLALGRGLQHPGDDPDPGGGQPGPAAGRQCRALSGTGRRSAPRGSSWPAPSQSRLDSTSQLAAACSSSHPSRIWHPQWMPSCRKTCSSPPPSPCSAAGNWWPSSPRQHPARPTQNPEAGPQHTAANCPRTCCAGWCWNVRHVQAAASAVARSGTATTTLRDVRSMKVIPSVSQRADEPRRRWTAGEMKPSGSTELTNQFADPAWRKKVAELRPVRQGGSIVHLQRRPSHETVRQRLCPCCARRSFPVQVRRPGRPVERRRAARRP